MTIIKREPEPWGGHLVESQSHRTGNWMGGDWIAVPEALEAAVWQCGGWCELEIRDGVLAGLTPTGRPPAPEPEPGLEDIINTLLGVF